jgi:hypothetical protein
MPYSTELRNAKLAANTTIIGNSGRLEIYAGTMPATGGAEGTLLASFTLGIPFAPAPSNGVQSPTLPSATTGVANGTAGWARVTKSDGSTAVMDCTVGLSGSGAQIILNTLSISTGVAVSITSWTITAGDA